ncbi:MAG: hypothetical protein M3025_07165 [Actinomycetota bacterium]|nr:hypothetical protein [Actinomycetota bacterium]
MVTVATFSVARYDLRPYGISKKKGSSVAVQSIALPFIERTPVVTMNVPLGQ